MRRALLVALALAALGAAGSAPAAGVALARHDVSGLPVSVALPVSWQSVSVPAALTPTTLARLVATDPAAAALANPYLARAGVRFLGNEPVHTGRFTANVNLRVEPLPRTLTLRAWLFSGASALMQLVGRTTAFSSGGTSGLHYRSTKAQKYGTVPLLTDIYAFAYGGRVFVFTYTSLASDAARYASTFAASGRSIRFGGA